MLPENEVTGSQLWWAMSSRSAWRSLLFPYYLSWHASYFHKTFAKLFFASLKHHSSAKARSLFSINPLKVHITFLRKWLEARSWAMKDTDKYLKCRSCLLVCVSTLKTGSISSCTSLLLDIVLGLASEKQQQHRQLYSSSMLICPLSCQVWHGERGAISEGLCSDGTPNSSARAVSNGRTFTEEAATPQAWEVWVSQSRKYNTIGKCHSGWVPEGWSHVHVKHSPRSWSCVSQNF